jgi:hypothetical protein
MQDKKIQFVVLAGALLLTGLFFYSSSRQKAKDALKPSDVNFTTGNYPISAKQSVILSNQSIQAVAIAPAKVLPPEDQKKWEVFQDVVNSKNDNDPRLDRDLRVLSPEMHLNLQSAYETLPAENRNARGLIAFLIARDLKSAADLEFLRKIYQESPCLSVDNCTVASAPDPHFDGVNQTSLNYPQLAALYQLERKLEGQPDLLRNPEIKNLLTNLLRDARQFPSEAIQKRAEAIRSRYGL